MAGKHFRSRPLATSPCLSGEIGQQMQRESLQQVPGFHIEIAADQVDRKLRVTWFILAALLIYWMVRLFLDLRA